jgi:hypothetical protein
MVGFSEGVILGVAGINTALVSRYALATFRGDIRPNLVSWVLWALAPFIGSSAAFAQGVTWATVPVLVAGINPLLVLLAACFARTGYWKISRVDWTCGFFSFLALLLWGITNNPDYALFFSIVSDGTAALPTLIKAWKAPESESPTGFIGGVLSSLTSFLAVGEQPLRALAFPVYLALIDSLILACLFLGRQRRANALK